MNAIATLPILERLGLKGRKPNNPPSAGDYAGALDRAERQREAAAASLAALAEERASLLLLGDDGSLDAIEQRQQTAARELDRLDAAISELERRYEATIATEQAAGRAKLIQQHSEAAKAAVENLHGALIAAETAADALRETIAEAAVDGVPQCAPADLRFMRRLTAADIMQWHASATRLLDPPTNQMRSDLIPLRFLAQHNEYSASEVAGFTPERARGLIDAGAAVLMRPEDELILPPPKPDYASEPMPPPDQAGKIAIIFLKHQSVGSFGSYNPGETASFLAITADSLVRRGVARFVGSPRELLDAA